MTRENDDSSSKVDIIDAIAKEIDMTWAIIGSHRASASPEWRR
jgi:hypothetical protein